MISSKFIHSLDTIEMSIIQAKRKNRKKHVPSADLSLAFEGVYTCCTSSYFPYFKWPIINSIVCFQARKFGRDFGWAWNNNLIEWSQNSIECYWFLFSFRFVSHIFTFACSKLSLTHEKLIKTIFSDDVIFNEIPHFT